MRPASGRDQPGQTLQRQRLARARGPEQHGHAAARRPRHVERRSPAARLMSGPRAASLTSPARPAGWRRRAPAHDSTVSTPTSTSAVVLLARLHRGVDRQRHRRGLAGNVAGQHQRRAELAERAREGEHEPGQDAVAGQRQRHLQRRPPLRAAERVGRSLEVAIDRLDRRPRRAHEQRQRHHRGRDHRRVPGERDAPAGQLRTPARRASRDGRAAR